MPYTEKTCALTNTCDPSVAPISSGLGARLPRRIGDVGENEGTEYTDVGLDGCRCEAVIPSRLVDDAEDEDEGGSVAVATDDERCGAATASRCGCVCAIGCEEQGAKDGKYIESASKTGVEKIPMMRNML